MSKKQPKLTGWFPGHIKPAREGVYQQSSGFLGTLGYQRWAGGQWYAWRHTPEDAARANIPAATSFQNDKWRGLAVKP